MKKLFIILFCAHTFLHALIDLETNCSSFVVSTKKIEIPGFPNGFNPSLVKWQGELLLMFRYQDPLTGSTAPFVLVKLDENFNPICKPQIFTPRPRAQDPRFCRVKNRLYIVFNDVVEIRGTENAPVDIRRMFLSELYARHHNFHLSEPIPFLNFPEENPERSEKNWVPFAFNNQLLLSYSINPHRVFSLHPNQKRCEAFAETTCNLAWKWGVLRGGTEAHLVNGEYLSFFHSSKSMATVHSQGAMIPHYFIGAYTFKSFPPFALSRVSEKPIVGPDFYHGQDYKTWKPLRVVFPMSYISDDDYLYLTYGRQDHEMWIATIDKKALLESLIEVK